MKAPHIVALALLLAGCPGDNAKEPTEAGVADSRKPTPDTTEPRPDQVLPQPDVIPSLDGSGPDVLLPRDGPSPTPDGSSPKPDGPSPTPDGPSPTPDGPSPTPDGPSPRDTTSAGDSAHGCSKASDCANRVCVKGKCVRDPLAQAFSGAASFVKDQTALGRSFGMHFVSMQAVSNTIYAHYIDNIKIGSWRSRVGLATSTDARVFVRQGVAFDIGGSWETTYDAVKQLSHNTGKAEADGWSAATAAHAAGYMIFGPYQTLAGKASRIVSFDLLVDSIAGHVKVVNLEVNDATTGKIVAQRTLYRDDFSRSMSYQIFNLGFTPQAAHKYEYRVYWFDTTYTKVRQIALATGKLPLWDDRLASFPGVLKLGATWHMVYEGASADRRWPGDVGLVRSTDPRRFIRQRDRPFLVHNTSGWERVNIGTPSLYWSGQTFYLFYHGFDGKDVQIGVATYAPGSAPVKYANNPILRTSANGWDSGTVGARSQVIREGGYYYMAFEGSTDAPFDKARWSTGLARSTDLLHWSKSPVNPLLPQTPGGFGNDGPELLVWKGRVYLFVRAGPNATDRYILRSK